MSEGVYMTQKELDRAELLARVKDRRLNQRQAAEMLHVSLRQLQRLFKVYREKGAIALASKKRGRTSNNKIPESIRGRVSEIVTEELYAGFGPTLMSEKLEELHKIKISRETTRQIMIECGVWRIRKQKRLMIHQQRLPRARAGELVQIDGSPHAWFEDRGEPCTLLVFIDDATRRTYGKFIEAETTAGYMQTMAEYITQYGAPLAVYSDQHSIFRINHGQSTKKENFTQFGRALHELDIELIYANSPQAKGRVERKNRSLQDRLIKEMRLAGINTIAEANRFLEEYWGKYNKRFAILPACSEDAHRAITPAVDLTRILCEKQERIISKNLEFQFENVIYQVALEKPCRSLIGTKVTAIKHLDGTLSFEYKGSPLPVKKYDEQISSGVELSYKELDHHFRSRGSHKVPRNHPWVQAGRAEIRIRQYQNA